MPRYRSSSEVLATLGPPRYEFVPDGWSPPYTLTLDWDKPWRAYVALVSDYSRKPPQEDWVIIRVGCKPPLDRYPDLDDMMRALNAALAEKLPAVTLSPEMRQRLLDDKRWHFEDLRRRGIDPMEPLDFSDGDDEDEEPGPSLAIPPLYVLRTATYCPQCRQATFVYMLGCAAFHDAEDSRPVDDFHFLRRVESVPRAVQRVLKTKCPGFTLDHTEPEGTPYLMNHCRCGARLDDDFVCGDVGAAFWPDTPGGYRDFKLHELRIDEPIPVECSYMLGGGDYLDFSRVW
jgi:hypothetical protein